MKWFKNLGTQARLMIGFGLLGLITAGVGWFGVNRLGILHENTDAIYRGELVALLVISDITDDLQRLRQYSYMMFTPIGAEEAKAAVARARALDLSLIQHMDKFQPMIVSDVVRAHFNGFREALARYRQHREERQYEPLLAGQKE